MTILLNNDDQRYQKHFLSCLNLFLAGEEDEDVAKRLSHVYLKNGDNGSIKVVSFRSLGVVDVDRVPTAGDAKNWSVIEEL